MVEALRNNHNADHPPIVEREGRRLAVMAFSDIDGTINNEGLPDSERLGSIGPAKHGIGLLETRGIPVGLITARSLGEAEVYQNAIGNKGITICEDGAVVLLPPHTLDEEHEHKLSERVRLMEHNGSPVVLLSSVDAPAIERFLSFTEQEAIKRGGQPPESSTPHLSSEDTNTGRIGSVYAGDTTEIQRKVIQEHAQANNIRYFGRPQYLHLVGADAHKGTALQFINDNIKLFMPSDTGIDGILPIVFGNNENDLVLLQKAREMGGIGVLVMNVRGGYSVPEEKLDRSIMKATKPYGHGITEAIPHVLEALKLT